MPIFHLNIIIVWAISLRSSSLSVLTRSPSIMSSSLSFFAASLKTPPKEQSFLAVSVSANVCTVRSICLYIRRLPFLLYLFHTNNLLLVHIPYHVRSRILRFRLLHNPHCSLCFHLQLYHLRSLRCMPIVLHHFCLAHTLGSLRFHTVCFCCLHLSNLVPSK